MIVRCGGCNLYIMAYIYTMTDKRQIARKISEIVDLLDTPEYRHLLPSALNLIILADELDPPAEENE